MCWTLLTWSEGRHRLLIDHAFFNLLFLRAELAHSGTGLPQLAFTDLTQFLLELFAVVGLTTAFNGALCFLSRGDTLVEFLEHRKGCRLETFLPIECAALGSGRAVGVHPVHAVFCDQRHQ